MRNEEDHSEAERSRFKFQSVMMQKQISKHVCKVPLSPTSQTVQCQRVSTWCLHSLQVYTKRSCPWLCSSTNIHMVLHLHLLRELNSQCLSLAKVRKASRPSIRSQVNKGSGSMMGGSVLMTGPAWRWITKNTWERRGEEKRRLFVRTAEEHCHRSIYPGIHTRRTAPFVLPCGCFLKVLV